MSKKDTIKLLLPGIIVGFALGMGLTALVGVNKENEIPNFIGGAMCCGVPTLLNTLIVLKMGAKQLKRKLTIKQALLKTLPFTIIALIFGFLTVSVLVSMIFKINTCELTVLKTSLYQAVLGVLVSTTFAYIALKLYENKK